MSLSKDSVQQIMNSLTAREITNWAMDSNRESLMKDIITIYDSIEQGDNDSKELALTKLVYMGLAIQALKNALLSLNLPGK